MSDMKIKLVLEAIDKATKPLQRIGAAVNGIADKAGIARMEEVGRRVKAIGAVGAKAGLALGGVFGAGAFAVKHIVATAAEFERIEAVLKTTEGSAEKAKAALGWVSDFAAETPYKLQEVADAFKTLRTYGLDPTSGLLRTLGDTSAAMGKNLGDAVEAIADAVTGENERLKTFGITARSVGDQFVYEYTKNGETMTKAAKKSSRAMIQATLEAS
jgi:phage tail tape-measure protein